MTKNFTHLHVHTTYSLLDGISRREDLIKRCKDMGMSSLAITDHGNIYNAVSFHKSCMDAGIKGIIGQEFYVAPDSRTNRSYDTKSEASKKAEEGDLSYSAYHLTILAKNKIGYENLKKLSTIAWREGFYRKPRIDLDILKDYKEGLIVMSGCLASMTSRLIIGGQKDKAIELIDKERMLFGDDFFIELMHHGIGHEEDIVNEALIDISKKHGIPMVMTNDSHYTHKDDVLAHEVALCVGTNKSIHDPTHFKFNGEGYWFKTAEEMYMSAEIAGIPEEALTNTNFIADRIEDYGIKLTSNKHPPQIPLFRNENGEELSSEACHSLLETKVWSGLIDRGYANSEEHKARVVEELSMIKKKNFSSYFLIIADIIDFMRKNKILPPIGRGSSLGSLACYCLYITGLDPIYFGIPFSRFINEGRKDLPDIDTDISQERRKEVIDYITSKYGKDRVAQIITFQSMAAKAAMDNVGRALGVPHETRRHLGHVVGETGKDKLDDILESNHEAKSIVDNVPNWYPISVALEGNNKNTSVHAAGIVICNEEIDKQVPLVRDSKEGYKVTQYDMKNLQELGLLKLDMLGLRTLDLIQYTLELINERHGLMFDFHRFPLEDKATYKLVSSGKYVSVFQYDSSGIRIAAKQLQPEKFDHLVALNALYRPGPMERVDGKQSILEQYIERRHGRQEIEVWHEDLRDVFKDTMGLCIEENQLVTLADGGKKPIKDIKIGDRVLSINSTYNTVSNVLHTGEKECVKITTETGRELILTYDHILMANTLEKRAGDLAIGDFIHMPYASLPSNEQNDLTIDQTYTIGLLLGDGSVNATTPIIALGNDKQWRTDTLKQFNNAWPELIPHEYHKCRSYYLSLKQREHGPYENILSTCLKKLGLRNSTCKNKFVPHQILNSNDQSRLAVLAGLWDSDGTVSNAVHFTSESKQLIYDVDRILSHFKISHYINRLGNRVLIRDVGKFMDIVPLRHHAKLVSKFRNSKWLRMHKLHLTNHFKNSHMKSRDYAKFMGIARASLYNNRNCIAAKTADKIDNNLNNMYYQLHDSERVIHIENVGTRSVYDISMSDTTRPWFAASDILVHNCIYQESVMKMSKVIAGFNDTEADEYRAAIGKKDKAKFDAANAKFKERAVKLGRDPIFMDDLIRKLEGFARYGWNIGHCLLEDTKVLTCDRGLVSIKDVVPGEELWSVRHDTGDLFRNRVINVIDNGVKPIRKISAGGNSLICTGNHPILTTKHSYKNADELVFGDKLQMLDKWVTPSHLNIMMAAIANGDKIPLRIRLNNLKRNNMMDLEPISTPAKHALKGISPGDSIRNRQADLMPIVSSMLFSSANKLPNRFRINSNAHSEQSLRDRILTSDTITLNDTIYSKLNVGCDSINFIATNTPFLKPSRQTGTGCDEWESLPNCRGSIASINHVNNGRLMDLIQVNRVTTNPTKLPTGPFSSNERTSTRVADNRLRVAAAKTLLTVSSDDFGGGLEFDSTSDTHIIDFHDYLNTIDENTDGKIIHPHTIDSNIDLQETGHVYDLEMEQDPNFIANGFVVHNSIAYSYISFVTAYLEAHYPIEYYTTLLNVNVDDNDQLKVLLAGILQHGVQILPPDANNSKKKFTTDGKNIYMGLYSIRQFGDAALEPMMTERSINGPYKDYIDFCIRLGGVGKLSSLVKKNMVKAGAFRFDASMTEYSKHENTEIIQDIAKKYTAKGIDPSIIRSTIEDKIIKHEKEWTNHDLLENERSVLNFYISSHPVTEYIRLFDLFNDVNFITPSQLQTQTIGTSAVLFGVVESKVMGTTKKGDPFLKLKVGDQLNSSEIMVWSPKATEVFNTIPDQVLVFITGVVKDNKFRPGENQLNVSSVTQVRGGIPINSFYGRTKEDAIKILSILGISDAVVSEEVRHVGSIVQLKSTALIQPKHYSELNKCTAKYCLNI